MRTVLAVVRVFGWSFDDIDVGTLCGICRPLNGYTRPTDTGGDAVEEFEFGDEEMVKGLVPFPNPCSSIEDGMLVFVETVQRVGYFNEGAVVDGV